VYEDVAVGVAVSFEALFVGEYPKLVALGLAACGDREVARDLAQETMIRAHARWDEVAGYDSPAGWLRRVMSNLLIDHHRSATAGRAALGRLATSASSTVREPVSPATRWAELVAVLTSQQRIVATLYYAEDRSVDEIARILGISPGAVKSTLSKARDRLRRHEGKGIGDSA
jgi:RNA polymerase sigma-70 factor, ECF subfamily